MTRYICPNLPSAFVRTLPATDLGQPLECPFIDCRPCTARRRATRLPDPTASEEDVTTDDPWHNAGPIVESDWGISPK